MAKIIPNEEKVFMVSKSTNTTYSGSASLKAMQEWYTMEDVANTVKPYKVFTALLTQSGGDNAQLIYSGELTVGVTYYINGSGGWDFTNVGAPNNNAGTTFMATGTTPNSWGTADPGNGLSYNTGAPVATVLENTLGDVWFSYGGVGGYYINSNGLFTANKTTTAFMPNQYTESPSDLYNFNGYFLDGSNIAINSYFNYNTQDGLYGGFASNSIEIRVYN